MYFSVLSRYTRVPAVTPAPPVHRRMGARLYRAGRRGGPRPLPCALRTGLPDHRAPGADTTTGRRGGDPPRACGPTGTRGGPRDRGATRTDPPRGPSGGAGLAGRGRV